MKVLMLVKNSQSSRFVYNSIKNEFDICKIIMEPGANKYLLLKRRIKRLGLGKVLGQLMFQVLGILALKQFSRKRISSIIENNHLNNEDFDQSKIIRVNSINENKVIDEINKLNPDIVVVNGTRIISKNVLESTKAKFMNIHVGITPKYRGVHGGYWALVNNDYENCGVTVHLIDQGVDTGDIIYQDKIEITNKDNFLTYPLLQISKGIDLLKRALKDFEEDKLVFSKNDLDSKLWYHPTLFQYIYNRLLKEVK
ncbi:formyl transferase [Aestuariivivens marinum]|uniref:formyl transferase n=1 Tax=Aestuariivivens marinum TaxID=2913555 RepID=UPI001F5A9384|nr:formyl transferase [Aestuariivivens marinum]